MIFPFMLVTYVDWQTLAEPIDLVIV